jgi:hypothetical protein
MIFICSMIEPGQSVRNDQRQCILMFRSNVNEMNVEPIDFGDELRQGVQFCLDLSPVIIGHPITRECLHRRELHTLRASVTVSRSGHLVAFIRLRNSVRSASGTFT